MKRFWQYLNHSNLKISFDLNPFVWSFVYMHQAPTDTDPDLSIWYLRLLPVGFILTIDTGRCIIPVVEEDFVDHLEDIL